MGYLRFVCAVLLLVLGWICGHWRGFGKGVDHAQRLVDMKSMSRSRDVGGGDPYSQLRHQMFT